MSITIKHLDGPLAGQAETFPDEIDEIVFGRELGSDVMFPPECTIVGKKHLTLRRNQFGEWAVEFPAKYSVAIDGKLIPHDLRTKLPRKSVLRLGGKKGPSFEVSVKDERSLGRRVTGYVTLAATALQELPKSALQQLHDNRRTVAFLTVAVGVALFATWGWTIWSNYSTGQQIEALAKQQEKLAKRDFVPDTREKLKAAVYLIVHQRPDHQDKAIGTAWAYDASTLGTNAHVIKAIKCIVDRKGCKTLSPGGTVWLRSPHLEKDLLVTSWTAHAGYEAFPKELEKIEEKFPYLGDISLPSTYDVGIIKTSGALPPPYLEIADKRTLTGLSDGEPVAYAGFPFRALKGESLATKDPAPKLQFGKISSMADVFLTHADNPEERVMMHHSIPGTGGASGSPVINTDGDVVAVFSGGNTTTIDGAYVPNAALVNFAQRADLLRHVIDKEVAEELTRDKPYWHERPAELDNYAEHARVAFKAEAKRRFGIEGEPQSVAIEEGQLRSGIDTVGSRSISKKYRTMIESGWVYGFLILPESRHSIGFRLFDDSGPNQKLDRGGHNRRYVDPREWPKADRPDKIEALIWTTAEAPVSYELHVYRWKSEQAKDSGAASP